MREPYLSVVVPVYNVYEYVERCIKSIQNQTYKNLAIIIVDDGSKDNSAQVCEELAKTDSRITFIKHKENKGVVSARNTGIEYASRIGADYITFVDPDDWIESDLYEQMVNDIEDFDVLVADRCYCVSDKATENIHVSKKLGTYCGKRMECIWDMMVPIGVGEISPNMVDKLFRMDIVKKMYKSVDTGIKVGEDCIFVMIYLLNCSSAKISDIIGYHYCMRENSVSNSININVLTDLSMIYKSLLEIFSAHYYKERLLAGLSDGIIIWAKIFLLKFMGLTTKNGLIYYPYYGRLDGKKIVLYGAGEVGQAYAYEIKKEYDVNMVLWVDKNYKKYQEKGMEVYRTDMISSKEYDYILIAVWNEEVYLEIKKELLLLGIDEHKLLWNKTKYID